MPQCKKILTLGKRKIQSVKKSLQKIEYTSSPTVIIPFLSLDNEVGTDIA